jgi:3-methylcrotonyl-CoA carboxylase alpha subunit
MSHEFQLLGNAYETWLSRADKTYRLHVGEASIPVAIAERSDDLQDLTCDGVNSRVYVARHGDDVHVHLDGETYLLRYSHGLKRFAGQEEEEGSAVARSPMPGSVISLMVKAGEPVQRGQTLLVIESMKMETAITAASDGTVQSVHVALGQTFDRDDPLVTLERGTSQS